MTKRVFDVVVALVLLVLFAPLIAVLVVAIEIEAPGPVFYRARRVGRNGFEFSMLKLRKMHRGAKGGPLTLRHDERLTRVGRFLASSKLDELPQLWNVVRGDMSLVGPRPEDPTFVARHAPAFREVLEVRPGVTGFAQLVFRSESELLDSEDPAGDYGDHILPQKLALDRSYLAVRSLRVDIAVLWWTFLVLVFRRSGEKCLESVMTRSPGIRGSTVSEEATAWNR